MKEGKHESATPLSEKSKGKGGDEASKETKQEPNDQEGDGKNTKLVRSQKFLKQEKKLTGKVEWKYIIKLIKNFQIRNVLLIVAILTFTYACLL